MVNWSSVNQSVNLAENGLDTDQKIEAYLKKNCHFEIGPIF